MSLALSDEPVSEIDTVYGLLRSLQISFSFTYVVVQAETRISADLCGLLKSKDERHKSVQLGWKNSS